MYIFSAFHHSTTLELAITELHRIGITKEDILAVPLTKVKPRLSILDTIYRSDGISFLDGAFILATIFMALGVIYGFVLSWGPIIWGLIGLITGFTAGLFIDIYFTKRKRNVMAKPGDLDVVLLIQCEGEACKAVEDIIRAYRPLGMAAVETP